MVKILWHLECTDLLSSYTHSAAAYGRLLCQGARPQPCGPSCADHVSRTLRRLLWTSELLAFILDLNPQPSLSDLYPRTSAQTHRPTDHGPRTLVEDSSKHQMKLPIAVPALVSTKGVLQTQGRRFRGGWGGAPIGPWLGGKRPK